MKFFVKLIFVSVLILLCEIIVRYLIEQTGLIRVTPFTVPFYESNFLSIYSAFIWELVIYGWSYVLFVVLATKFISRYMSADKKVYRIVVFMLFFIVFKLLFNLMDVEFRSDLFFTSMIVAVLVGIILGVPTSILGKYSFRENKKG